MQLLVPILIGVYAASVISPVRIKTFDWSPEGCQFSEWRWTQARSDGQSRQLAQRSVFLTSFLVCTGR
jgi:hypothetical protein